MSDRIYDLYNAAVDALRVRDITIEDLRREVERLTLHHERLHKQRLLANETIASLVAEVERLKNDLQGAYLQKQENERLREQLRDAERARLSALDEAERLRGELAYLRTVNGVEEIDRLRAQRDTLGHRIEVLQAEIEKWSKAALQADREVEQLRDNIMTLLRSENDLRREVERRTQDLDEMQAHAQRVEAEVERLTAELNVVKEDRDKVTRMFTNQRDEVERRDEPQFPQDDFGWGTSHG
jgi:chromosome segregation ATPase